MNGPRLSPPLVVVMGVAGCGKTTVGTALATSLGVPFVDADDLHPPANIARMRQGRPLDDAARAPWLDAVHAALAGAGGGLVVACSALKQAYRQRLADGLPGLRFVHLQVERAVLDARLAQRAGHFFPPALLDDQLATLEAPRDAVVVDGGRPVAEVVAAVVRGLCRVGDG